MKTGEDLKNQVEVTGLENWPIHRCQFCNYAYKYIFRDGRVFFDSGCGCVPGPSEINEVEWNDVAEYYNTQISPGVIERFKLFWGFKE